MRLKERGRSSFDAGSESKMSKNNGALRTIGNWNDGKNPGKSSGCGESSSGRSAFLPVSRSDMEARGWEGLDFLFISGDAYVDHPSFAAALVGRLLEREGYRVGIIPNRIGAGMRVFWRWAAPGSACSSERGIWTRCSEN